MNGIRQVAVVGAGTMGADIAQVVALGGYEVILTDTDERILRLALARVARTIEQGVRLNKVDGLTANRARHAFRITTDLAKCAPADVVIEAVYDDLAVKQTLFDELDEIVRDDTILASSTNTLSITTLAQKKHGCRDESLGRIFSIRPISPGWSKWCGEKIHARKRWNTCCP
ncbi:MAG TPA: 3-hydroxyacyl-CoA dehydrogenase NAD-binding domain-containing protein [Aggregatilineaceae bacterium]|nr:3-hydroxyacyl-CoA dehydrogenase NAD-binding domain-containing protein [Aggregatilineaceae bacterium]